MEKKETGQEEWNKGLDKHLFLARLIRGRIFYARRVFSLWARVCDARLGRSVRITCLGCQGTMHIFSRRDSFPFFLSLRIPFKEFFFHVVRRYKRHCRPGVFLFVPPFFLRLLFFFPILFIFVAPDG